MTKYGLTDLERGKYFPGGTESLSTVRVGPDRYSTLPAENFVYQVTYLESPTATIDQNVNGSVTPVDFKFSPPSTQYVKQLTFSVVGLNMASIMDYFNLSGGLTNGIKFLTKEGVLEREIFNVKKTIELSHASTQGIINNYIQGNASEDIFIADMVFPFESTFGPTRELIIRIRDDLSSIRYQRATVIHREVIP
jgi:hypothetical protein